MSKIDQPVTVGEWVAQHPQSARVFEEYQIDYCCGGSRPLAQVCTANGLDADQIASRLLTTIVQPQEAPPILWKDRLLGELCDHIEATHHAYLRQALPRLDQMTDKVARVHGDKEPKLLEIRTAFVELESELMPHMIKEEQILFPIIRKLEASTARPEFHCGSVNNPIRQMEHEHDHAGATLKKLRELTNDFTPPDWACNTYRALFDGLRELEENMHQHVHKENNVLFVKAVELEACLPGQSAVGANLCE